jgi:streptomycin 6-kinase
VAADPIDEAIVEARRRLAISDRDVSSTVDHFVAAVRPVCRVWGLTAERWLDGGAGTPPLAVATADGTPAVLKISGPGSLDTAVRVMQAASGRGYVRVLAWDATRGALLTERLGEGLWEAAPTLAEQAQVVVPLLRDAWSVPLDCGSPFAGKASSLLGILADLAPRYGSGHPGAVALARRYAIDLSAAERPEVVCHGDPHPGNVLRRDGGWALIDPDGFIGERAYDLGVVLRDACREIVAEEAVQPGSGLTWLRERCRHVGRLADVDPERVWRWGLVERVTSGLYLRWFGHAAESATFLDTAETLAVSLSRPEGTAYSGLLPAQE